MGRRLVALLVVVALAGCWPSDEPSPPAPTTTRPTAPPTTRPAPPQSDCISDTPRVTRDISYGPAALQALDLTVPHPGPRCRPVPVLVWVHGGGFTVGDKRNGMTDKVAWALDNGWAIASVNYRLSPTVRHPAHADDVASAVAHLVDHADELGLDPTRIALAGHSAGAFIVAMVGTDDTYLERAGVDPDAIRAVAALDTRYDIAAEVAEDNRAADMYCTAFGTDPAVWRDASPITHAAGDPDVPPFLVVTRGQLARRQGSQAFAGAIQAGGGQATLVDASPLSHEQVNDVLGQTSDTRVTPPVTALLRSALA